MKTIKKKNWEQSLNLVGVVVSFQSQLSYIHFQMINVG